MSAPLLKGLIGIFGEAEIRYSGEPLLDPIVPIRVRQLQGPQHAEHIEQIAAHFVLPALAAIQSQQQHGIAVSPRLQRHHAAVFVIGMSRRVHQPRGRA